MFSKGTVLILQAIMCLNALVLYLVSLSIQRRWKLGSLCRNQVGAGDVVSLEDLGPEAGQLMAVVDLDDMELLKDAAVKSHLVVFEGGENFAA